MVSFFNTPCHGMTDPNVLRQWKRLHELLLDGLAVMVDDVTVRRELDTLLQQLDVSMLFDRNARDAFLAFSFGLSKTLSDFADNRTILLWIEEMEREMEYSSKECQSLLCLVEGGSKVSHEMYGYLRVLVREISRIGRPSVFHPFRTFTAAP